MNYRIANPSYYKTATNMTEIQIICDSPYTVVTRDVVGDLTGQSKEKQIQAVLEQLAMEFDPTDKIKKLDATFSQKISEMDAFIEKSKEEFGSIKTQYELMNDTMLDAVETLGSLVETKE